MVTIGNQFEAARKRQNISLSDASKATKIRSDYLLNFEKNRFHFPLPEIYKRGFIKIYARFLSLDPKGIISQYDTLYVKIPTDPSPVSIAAKKKSLGQISPSIPVVIPNSSSDVPDPSNSQHSNSSSFFDDFLRSFKQNRSLYLKVGGVFLGIFFIFGLISLLIGISSESSDALPDPLAETQIIDQDFIGKITLIASENTRVIIRQLSDSKVLFRGTIAAEEPKTLSRKGNIIIISPTIENLTVQISDSDFKANQSGLGKWFFGKEGPYTP